MASVKECAPKADAMFFKDAEIKVANKSVHRLVTLKKNYEFNFVFKKGQRFGSKSFTLIVAPCRKNIAKYGIVISKKIGKAVVRNKKRRQIKEILRKLYLVPNQYVFVAKENISVLTFNELENEIFAVVNKYLVGTNEYCTKNNNSDGERI